jgi:hypothetical protein
MANSSGTELEQSRFLPAAGGDTDGIAFPEKIGHDIAGPLHRKELLRLLPMRNIQATHILTLDIRIQMVRGLWVDSPYSLVCDPTVCAVLVC